jgi:hypothetical protein
MKRGKKFGKMKRENYVSGEISLLAIIRIPQAQTIFIVEGGYIQEILYASFQEVNFFM